MKNTIFLYKRHKIIYTDPVSGDFNNIRILSMSFIAIIFFITPWINYKARQAIIFDISFIRFYFFKFVFWAQDFVFFAILGIILILLLFTVTVYVGRIWCGFLCPQSIWIRLSNFITRLIEGNRNARVKLDAKKQAHFLYKKIIKHILFLFLSFVTAITFIGYFVPILYICNNILSLNLWSFFWISFFTLLVYFNIYWFKEQFCFLVCPYARLQSVMFDENTLTVAYNAQRGEKRGHRKKNDDYNSLGLGDCIDCKKCVTCCPTGIDIRDGLQIECISCGACIDACNSVMKKMGYEKNLISFSRENINKKTVNIRFITYFIALVCLSIVFFYYLFTRELIQFNITRSQMQLYHLTSNNLIENFYNFKIINKTLELNKYKISLCTDNFTYTGLDFIILHGEETLLLDVKVSTHINNLTSRFTDLYFKIENVTNKKDVSIKKNKFISSK
ncbi:MAG TPA: cytochrome c oxidase accessory protein CcoG [Candidatus Azoamicus sp. OHIO2]